jgi:hypothetical protein
MKDLLIGILIGVMATLLCQTLIEIKRMDVGKADKHKIIEVSEWQTTM